MVFNGGHVGELKKLKKKKYGGSFYPGSTVLLSCRTPMICLRVCLTVGEPCCLCCAVTLSCTPVPSQELIRC